MDAMRQRILVVDDDPSLAEMLTIVLRGEGFDTAVIGDGSSLPISEPDGAIAVACSAGRRSPIAASLLRRAGWKGVVRVDGGGIVALASHGFRLEAAG